MYLRLGYFISVTLLKNLLTSLGVLSGLYFTAVSFAKVHDLVSGELQNTPLLGVVLVLLFGAPLVFWLVSAWAATLALTVKRHEIKHLDNPRRDKGASN